MHNITTNQSQNVAEDIAFNMESDLHQIDVLTQAIIRLTEDMPLTDPGREPIEVIAMIIIDKARELEVQRRRAAGQEKAAA